MTGNDTRDLLASYALDALDEREIPTIETVIEANPSLRPDLRRNLEIAGALAAGYLDGTEQASEALWNRIVAGMQEQPIAPVVPLRPRRRVMAAVAVAAVAAAAVLGVQVIRQRAELEDLRSDPMVAAIENARSGGALEVAMTGEVSAGIVLSQDGVGYVLGQDLPSLDADHTYQLWAVVDDRVVSAGVLGSEPGISPFHVDGDVAVFALTVEVVGGVVASEQEPVAVATLDA